MMIEPNMDELLPHVDSKYTLVSVAAKRAREIMEQGEDLSDNAVSISLRDIAAGNVEYKRDSSISDSLNNDLNLPAMAVDSGIVDGYDEEEETSGAALDD